MIENYVESGPANDDTNVSTHYVYDTSGNLAQFIDAKSHVTQFDYDGMGRVLTETNPLLNTWAYTYDGVGNLLTRRDANGAFTEYAYYPDNQLRRIDYHQNSTFVECAYDHNNNRTSMLDHLGLTTWTYDPLNRVIAQVDPFGRALRYSHDAAGNLTGMIYPDGNPVAYTYFKNNWLKTMVDPESNVTIYERDRVGNLTRILNPNSTITDLAYDRADRVLNLVTRQMADMPKTISAFAYSYNDVGHVTLVVNEYGWRNPAVVTETYSYDGLRRLAGMQDSEGVAMAYAYDKVGNRLEWTTNDDLTSQTPFDGFSATYTYNAANQLTTATIDADQHPDAGTFTFAYDRNGNRINREWTGPQGPPIQGTDYTFDLENRLIAAQDYQLNNNRVDRALTTLEYDGSGRRLVQAYDSKICCGGEKRTEYVFDGLDPVVEYSMLNGHRDNYYRGAGGRISAMHHFPAGTLGQMFWYHYNFKGDVAGLTKQDGQSTHNYRYDPYGGVVPDTGNFTDPHNHYTVTGKEYDENMGLVYFGARHYDPEIGMWGTQDVYRGDPRRPSSLYRYLYVEDDPISLSDYYGWFVFPIFMIPHQYDEKLSISTSSAEDQENYAEGSEEAYLREMREQQKKILKSLVLDFTPVLGELKGFAEIVTGTDLVTSEELGAWRWAGICGIFSLNELKLFGKGDEASDLIKFLRQGGDLASYLKRIDKISDFLRLTEKLSAAARAFAW